MFSDDTHSGQTSDKPTIYVFLVVKELIPMENTKIIHAERGKSLYKGVGIADDSGNLTITKI